ncbi:MAG: universal stress protein [Fidelibacterota bacterium]
MKILIAVSSKEYSKSTLQVGMKIAQAFNASTTIVDVGEKISEFSSKVVSMAHDRMESWEFDRPGMDVLEWAFHYLADHSYIKPQSIEAGFPTNTLIKTSANRANVYLKGTFCKNVNLILRNGDIISELRDEVHKGDYDVTIIGGSRKRRMAHDLIQFIDSSIFVVNQIDLNQSYRILLAVDDSRGTNRAVKFGAKVAHSYGIGVDILTVSKREHFGKGYKNAAERAGKFMSRSRIQYQNIFRVGDPVEVIINEAGNDHIIVMGSSTKSPITKFFAGSKPLKVMETCQCPILIVK